MIQRRQIEYSNRTLRMWKWINCVCRKCSARQKCFASLSIFVCISSLYLYRSVSVSHHWRARILKCGPHSMPFSGFIIQLATAGQPVAHFASEAFRLPYQIIWKVLYPFSSLVSERVSQSHFHFFTRNNFVNSTLCVFFHSFCLSFLLSFTSLQILPCQRPFRVPEGCVHNCKMYFVWSLSSQTNGTAKDKAQ